eukprot:scaffold1224_cov50-Attheya_sp.AAC.2
MTTTYKKRGFAPFRPKKVAQTLSTPLRRPATHSLFIGVPLSYTLYPYGTIHLAQRPLFGNLSHPNLVAAAKGLSPFFLRIGGSQADEIIYNIPQLNKDNASSSSSSTDDLKIACTNHPQKCLTAERWDKVLNFARLSGARVVFTVAYVRHTRDNKGNTDQRDWDSNNAKQFLEYTANSSAS